MRTLLVLTLMVFASIAEAQQRKVKGYYKKNGDYVEPYKRSTPNAHKWDNNNHRPSQPAYNPTYYRSRKTESPAWRQPNNTRFLDKNPYNDSPPANPYGTGKRKRYGSDF